MAVFFLFALLTLAATPAADQVHFDGSIALADVPRLGNPHAPVVIVEFGDFHCPFCRRYTREVFPRIRKEYIETGKVLYAFRHFPLDIHPRASDAAVAAVCAAREGRFWEIHERFFAAPRPVAPGELERHARAVGLDLPRFRICMKAGVAREDVRQDLLLARQIGLAGTPGFVIGYRDDAGDRVRPMRRMAGFQPYEVVKAALDALLAPRQMTR